MYFQQEETGREHSSALKPVKHEAPKPASIMPKLLPDVHLEAAELPPKAEPHLPGEMQAVLLALSLIQDFHASAHMSQVSPHLQADLSSPGQ